MQANRRSRTAQYAAVVRAVLTHKGIVSDEHALQMLTPSMRTAALVLSRLPRKVTDTAFYAGLATRTLAIDRELSAALEDGIRQVVIVGAGYDSRAWRFGRGDVVFFEVDHPATQADKKRRAPGGGPTFASVDLASDSTVEALDRAGIDWTKQVVFIIEGVTMYLDADDVAGLLLTLGSGAAPASRLVVNFAAPAGTGGGQDRRRQFVLAALGRVQGERFRSARQIRNPGAFVASAGWTVTQAKSLREAAPRLLPEGHGLDYRGINPQASVVVATAAGSPDLP